MRKIASLMLELGWLHATGRPPQGHPAYRIEVYQAIEDLKTALCVPASANGYH